jgi:hypothetical protein
MQVAFPTVAKIRKGTPKQKRTKNGRSYEIMGKDLKHKFRIEFLPGAEAIKQKFHALHEKEYVKYPEDKFVYPDGYEMEYIRAMLPTKNAMDSWHWSNETYNAAGTLIASADGEKYITKKDPNTGELLVKNGEPYTPFIVGDAVPYEKNGKQYFLKLKSVGKLDLFLPELGEFVSFELRTSSYIDSLNIYKNLMAIQGIADVLNGGVVGGIPLDIYRIEVETPYMDDNGSHKASQWFIQIKANSEWAESAIGRMNKYALGDKSSMLLPSVIEIPEEILPAEAVLEQDSEDGITVEEVKEEVKDGVVTEQNVQEEPVDEITNAQNIIIELYREIKKADKELGKKAGNVLKEYEPEIGDIRKVNDKALLKECWKKLNKINKEIK